MKRYIERKMKGKEEEDKICWIVSYVQGDRTDRWKERKVKDILKEIKREFRKDKKIEEDI